MGNAGAKTVLYDFHFQQVTKREWLRLNNVRMRTYLNSYSLSVSGNSVHGFNIRVHTRRLEARLVLSTLLRTCVDY